MEHIELCLACRGCETACPSGVQYGRLVEAARAEIENKIRRPWRERALRWLVFRKLLPSRLNLEIAGALLYMYQASGLKRLTGMLGFLPARLREVESLAPEIETPFFFGYYGMTLPPEGERRYRVAFLGGCIANISFARLNEATVRVLREEWMRNLDSRESDLLRRFACTCRNSRRSAQAGSEKYRCIAEWRLRRDHHERGRMRHPR